MKLLIGKSADFAGLALPDDGCLLLAPGFDVAIETVVGQIDLAPDKPLRPRALPFENALPLLEPVHLGGDSSPEFLWVIHRFLVQTLVVGKTLDVGRPAEFFRALELTLLLEGGIDVGFNDCFVGHVGSLRVGIFGCKPESSYQAVAAQGYFNA